jgi:hypothetical protein
MTFFLRSHTGIAISVITPMARYCCCAKSNALSDFDSVRITPLAGLWLLDGGKSLAVKRFAFDFDFV